MYGAKGPGAAKTPGKTPKKGDRDVPERLKVRNAKGGVPVALQEVEAAFQLLAGGGEYISAHQLEDFLQDFWKRSNIKDVRSMIGKNGMDEERLTKMLMNNEVTGLDPLHPVFKSMSNSAGNLDRQTLHRLLEKMPGVGQLDDEDAEYIQQQLDFDGDGAVSIEDWARVGGFSVAAVQQHRKRNSNKNLDKKFATASKEEEEEEEKEKTREGGDAAGAPAAAGVAAAEEEA